MAEDTQEGKTNQNAPAGALKKITDAAGAAADAVIQTAKKAWEHYPGLPQRQQIDYNPQTYQPPRSAK